jgi:phosphate acetyltransferase
MLSFSTNHSADHPLVDKVINATLLAKEAKPDLNIVGDVQFDAAIIPDIFKQKTHKTGFDKPANVLIFPSLEAGNIAYKLTERLGQADAIGPILQGLKRPINDLSRGCKTNDIVNAIAVTVVQSQNT